MAPVEGSSKAFLKCYFAACQSQGDRPYLQDRHVIVDDFLCTPTSESDPSTTKSLMAVFDGHTSEKSAEHARARLADILAQEPAIQNCTGAEDEEQAVTHAMRSAFERLDGEVLGEEAKEGQKGYGGTTAVCALRVGQMVYVANVGDSRAVLCREGEAVMLTQDHKPESVPQERERIEVAGGEVLEGQDRVRSNPDAPATDNKTYRLNVSRTVGDLAFKAPRTLVTATPDVTRTTLQKGRDTFLLLASDGIFDALSNQQAVDVVQEITKDLGQIPGEAVQAAADELVAQALQEGATDNCTVVLMLLAWD